MNAFRRRNGDKVLWELASCDFCSNFYGKSVGNVQSTLVEILEKCFPKIDYNCIKKAWGDLLDEVMKVFEEHAPLEVNKKLISKDDDDAYSFLLFLLVHFKLNFDQVPKVDTVEA